MNMTPRRRRMVLVGLIVLGVGAATAFALTAFQENLLYYYPPTDVTATRTSPTRIRIDFTQGTNAFKYYVYESRAGGPYTNVATVLQSSGPSTIRANLSTSVEYCYRLQAVTASNQVSPRSLPPACATP